jgi:hypothetical protein
MARYTAEGELIYRWTVDFTDDDIVGDDSPETAAEELLLAVPMDERGYPDLDVFITKWGKDDE